tara:strand:- start:98 stop:1402 length:1305 start_codon:yes stop_codon:yes gene_type:complete
MKEIEQEYKDKTSKSEQLFSKAINIFPGGICHPLRYFQPYPFYIKRAKGSKIWDVDNNQYTDYWMGHYSLIFGHSYPSIIKHLSSEMKNGTQWGIVNNLQIRLAEKIINNIKSAEMGKFVNTGMEANTYAIRLARAYTKNKIVLKAEGGWHGFTSDLMYGINPNFNNVETEGLLESESRYTKTIPFNDIEDTGKILNQNKEIACIIIEPVLGSAGFIPAKKEYLKYLSEESKKRGYILIFDEIITGFRLGLGGAQEYYNVYPDITVLGKILGGGLPIGALFGNKEIMKLADIKNNIVKIGGGTFSCNPLTMLSGLKTLEILENNKKIYTELNSIGDKFRAKVNSELNDINKKCIATGISSLFQLHYLNKENQNINNAKQKESLDNKKKSEELFLKLVINGFYLPRLHGAISYSHKKEENTELISNITKIAENIK